MNAPSDILRIAAEWFLYDPLTGVVTWKKKPNRNIPIGATAGCRWSDGTNTYIRVTVEGRWIFAHVLAHVLMTGELPSGVIDHDDGNGTNNVWTNLRDVTHKVNLRNQRRSSANTSGTMGVDFHGASQRWRARIIVDQREHHLGLYQTKEEAVIARLSAEREFGFHANHGRTV